MIRPPPRSTLFPSTTLFRSLPDPRVEVPNVAAGDVAKLPHRVAANPRSEEHTAELQSRRHLLFRLFFFNDPATPEIYPLPLHDALPISPRSPRRGPKRGGRRRRQAAAPRSREP